MAEQLFIYFQLFTIYFQDLKLTEQLLKAANVQCNRNINFKVKMFKEPKKLFSKC